MKEKLNAIITFLGRTIWLERRGARKAVGFSTRLLRVVVLVGKGFYDDKCFLRASGLAFTTLLSLAPLMAFAFSVLKGFGMEKVARKHVLEYVSAGQVEISEALTGYIDNVTDYIHDMPVSAFGALSLVFVLWTVVKLLGTVERSFNDIWGISRGRTLLRKLSDYTSVVIIAPLLLTGAIALSAYFSANPIFLGGVRFTFIQYLAGLGARVGPFALTSLAFTALYAFMPNTKVKASASLIGALVACICWMGAFFAYKTFQVGLARYNPIYGSLAALPFFLMWLYVSWVITLFGAEVSFAYQHVETYRRKLQHFRPSPAARERITLRVFLEVAMAFRRGAPPPDADALDRRLKVPVHTIREVLGVLEGAGLVSLVQRGETSGFQPGRELSMVTAGQVLDAVRTSGDALGGGAAGRGDLWKKTLGLAAAVDERLREGDLSRSIAEILESLEKPQT